MADEYKAYEFSRVSWNTEKSTSGVVDGLTGETETLAVDGEELAAKNAFRLDLAQIIRDKVAQRSAKSTPHHFRKNFHMMDKDGQKWQLTRAEFKEFLAKVNINLDEEGLQQVLQTFDEDNNGTVDYDEFVKVAVPPDFVKDDCGRYQGVTGITHNREFAQSGRLGMAPLQPRQPHGFGAGGAEKESWAIDPVSALKVAILRRGAGGGRELHTAFKRFDQNHDGLISGDEVTSVMKAFNINLSTAQSQAFLAEFFPAGEEIDYTTFCRKVMDRHEMENPFAWLGRFTEMRDQNINREQMQFGKRISIWGHCKADCSVRSTVY